MLISILETKEDIVAEQLFLNKLGSTKQNYSAAVIFVAAVYV